MCRYKNVKFMAIFYFPNAPVINLVAFRLNPAPMKTIPCLLLTYLLLINVLILLGGCNAPIYEKNAKTTETLRVAFMPDIHFHDVYGRFDDGAFQGLPTETAEGNQLASMRSMRAQLHSTRLFNENYFALLAALDDIARRNIKYVALPGDFRDDGQPVHLRGLKNILDKYQHEYGMEFFVAPGNHDPNRPFSRPAGKPDYMGQGGREVAVFSLQHPLCKAGDGQGGGHNPSLVCSDEVQELGYKPIMDLLGDHGFYPKENYHYFETPYSSYQKILAGEMYRYDYVTASRDAQFDNRHYEICHQGTGGKYKQASYSDCYFVPDTSYLVEPVPGLWLLAIDANVYQPKKGSNGNALDGDNFLGSSDAGYNQVITHKTHLLEWIADVVQRAHAQDKTLIAFSHFPMQDFYDGAADDIAQLMGDEKFQLKRNPATNTSRLLADTGLKIHVAGHMHINDTGVYRGDDGKVLFNIQAPSLAAYMPAYKILTVQPEQKIEVETIVLSDVPRFDELFPHYRAEWDYLQRQNAPDIWNKNILQAKRYHQFTEWHLRELARLRFLPQDWPADIRHLLMQLNGEQLLIISQLPADISLAQISAVVSNKVQDAALQQVWQLARQRAAAVARRNGLELKQFATWNGQDMSLDFYRLWSADQLALRDIDPQRFVHYAVLEQQLSHTTTSYTATRQQVESSRTPYQARLAQLLRILMRFSGDAPSDHFLLELDTGRIQSLP